MSNNSDLDRYYQQIYSIILSRQNPVTGLFPASTAITEHGDYTDAWVRDNVYSILAVWGLALAYRKSNENEGRTYQLEQSVVKLMRGLLTSMMRQAHKVERFKYTLDPLDALHAKYNTFSGETVVGDHEWGHLQIDATSLYLLMLAQMTASGLRIIFTLDEVNFIQNLVHYISRCYRTPDYGIWERGNKSNHGITELNASSVGMAKAAMEALSGFNLFGKAGGQSSKIHVISDEIARARIALESLLPRESISKEVDAAVLSVIGFPAFAVDNKSQLDQTEQRIIDKLQGNYGCKRFLLDGHQTVIEDSYRMYYEENELKQFKNLECEWPLFFCYLFLNKLFSEDQEKANDYRERLQHLLVEKNGQLLLPELYKVELENITAERENPHSQNRVPNENIPLVWAQSLFLLGEMVFNHHITLDDIDPLNRRHRVDKKQDRSLKIQVSLLTETDEVKKRLEQMGITSQTINEIDPVQIKESAELASAYTAVGINKALGLTGRPNKQIRSMGTSLLYLLGDEKYLFLPQFMNQRGYYLALDNHFLLQRLELEFNYVFKYWDRPGNPLITLLIKTNMLESEDFPAIKEFLLALKQGCFQTIPVQLGKVEQFLSNTSYEKINYLHNFHFSQDKSRNQNVICFQLPFDANDSTPVQAAQINQWNNLEDNELINLLSNSSNINVQIELLTILTQRHNTEFEFTLDGDHHEKCTVRNLLEEIYVHAGNIHHWKLLRRTASQLGKYDINLEQSVTEILVRQKPLSVGKEYSNKATLHRSADAGHILDKIRTYNTNSIIEHSLIQEIIIYLGLLIKSNPEFFKNIHTVRVGHILQLITIRVQKKLDCDWDLAFDTLTKYAPYQIAAEVKDTLSDYKNAESQLNRLALLKYHGEVKDLKSAQFPVDYNPKDRGQCENWHEWRQQKGSIGREPETLYTDIWGILSHCKGLIIGDELSHKRRVDSANTLAKMTVNEHSFVLLINHRLNKIQSPEHRQLTVETLQALSILFKETPELFIHDTLLVDTLITQAVKISWLQNHPDRIDLYEKEHSLSWQSFYLLPPNEVANNIIKSLLHLLTVNKAQLEEECK